jgi:hypothetical protein
MIFQNQAWAFCCAGSCLISSIIIILSSLYAYHVNSKRAPDDPEKKDYSPAAIWLAPFVLPPLSIFNFLLLFLSSLVFGVSLVLFPFTLLLFREPFLIKWLRRQALKLGNWALKINTRLLKAVGFHPTSIKLIREGKSLV